MVPMLTTLRNRGTIPMIDSMVNAWNILDHETTPRQRTLLDEIYHSNMTASLTASSMHPALLSICPARSRYVVQGTMESRKSRCWFCNSSGSSINLETVRDTAAALSLPKASTKSREPIGEPATRMPSGACGRESVFATSAGVVGLGE
jgi:hypothetical protein